MAFGVFHVLLDIELDLNREDLGHPSRPTLWNDLYRNGKLGVLQCLECRTERPDCPEWMYFRVRHGRREAVHFNSAIGQHAGESDAHKALKERIAIAAIAGGFEAVVEQRASHGKRRTDVLVRGNNVLLGCEPQLSPITAQTVRKRSAIAQADGITPMWMTDSRKAQLIDQAPWVRIDRMPWHHYLTDAQLPIRGGIRGLVIERCGYRSGICPDRRTGRACSGWHGFWEPRQLERFDELIVRAASADLVPVKQPVGESGKRAHWFWTTAEDVAKVEPPHLTEDEGDADDPLITTVGLIGQLTDRTCHYKPTEQRHRRRVEEKDEAPQAAIAVRLREHPGGSTSPRTARPRIEAHSGQPMRLAVVLNWSRPEQFSPIPQPCRICDRPAFMRDPHGVPCHKVCAEQHDTANSNG